MASKSPLSYLGAVKPAAYRIADEVVRLVAPRLSVIWGYNPASKPEHSSGWALDFMCTRDEGDAIANYLWENRLRLGLRWMIWRQRIRSTSPGKPNTWQTMQDRGSVTANHYDHVHALFGNVVTYKAPAGATVKPPTRPRGYRIDLAKLVEAARKDGGRPQGGITPGAEQSVRYVETMLAGRNLLSKSLAGDGSFGTSSVAAYAAWQRICGYRGADADGIPGRASLQQLINWWSPGNYTIV